jgi:hypothetical protein
MRERMVTRTVCNTEYTCMVVDTNSKTVENITVSIPSVEGMSKKNLEQAIRNAVPSDKLFVQAISERKVEILYGMLEQDFIKLAKVLPARNVK